VNRVGEVGRCENGPCSRATPHHRPRVRQGRQPAPGAHVSIPEVSTLSLSGPSSQLDTRAGAEAILFFDGPQRQAQAHDTASS
jgi:hypothetical protein